MRKLLLTTLLTMSFSLSAFAAPTTIYADVNGLVCDFCARALEKVFGKQEEVNNINVDLDTKIITINFKDGKSLTDEAVTKLITDSGYDVRGIRHE